MSGPSSGGGRSGPPAGGQGPAGGGHQKRDATAPEIPEASNDLDDLDAATDAHPFPFHPEAEVDEPPSESAAPSKSATDDHGIAPWGPPIFLSEYETPAFPIDAFPRTLREFVEAVAEDTQTPPDMAAMLSLAAVATCVQGRTVVQVTASYREPLSIFAAVVAESGERKSAVVAHVTAPLCGWERDAADKLRTAIETARSDRTLLEARQQATTKRAANAKTPDERRAAGEDCRGIAEQLGKVPPLAEYPRLLADDVTPEALARLMAAQGERMGVLSAEGGIFETMAGRYTNGISNLDVFLKGHAGDPIRVDRRNAQPIVMNRPALTFGLAIQPDVIRSLANKDGFRGRGLIARYLLALPISLVGSRRAKTKPVPERVAHAYNGLIRRLLSEEIDRTRDLLQGKEVPGHQRLTLTPAAEAARITFIESVEPRLGATGDLRSIADWGGKLAGATVRIAGLLHAATCAEASQSVEGAITGETMAAAIRVGEYLIPHALAVIGEMGADPGVEAARIVLRHLEELDESVTIITTHGIHRQLRGQIRFNRAQAVKSALGVLEERDYVRKLPKPDRMGRPSEEWQISPHVRRRAHGLNGQNGQNGQNSGGRAGSVHSVHVYGGTLNTPTPAANELDRDSAGNEPEEQGAEEIILKRTRGGL